MPEKEPICDMNIISTISHYLSLSHALSNIFIVNNNNLLQLVITVTVIDICFVLKLCCEWLMRLEDCFFYFQRSMSIDLSVCLIDCARELTLALCV